MAKNRCWICGVEESDDVVLVNRRGEDLNCPRVVMYRCYCKNCKEDLDMEDTEFHSLYVRLRKREMFKKACDKLESQGARMYEYRKAIQLVQNNIETYPDNYDSSYEVLAAIVLIQHGLQIKMQCKIGRYQVDVMIPSIHVILEIDGDRHKYHKEHDSNRDARIKAKLGSDWDIIRIRTEYLDQDARKLIQAIKSVIEYRQAGKVNWRKLYDKS